MSHAGEFGAWLDGARAGIAAGGDADVPCHGCRACCRSAHFVHVGPDEADTLAHLPAALLFPAPGLPPGHRVLGYDEHGRCPMLADEGCSIYEHRPRSCRVYDCRVLSAAKVVPDEPGTAPVAERVRQWSFSYAGPRDRLSHEAVAAAARYLDRHQGELPGVPATTTRRAALAVELHGCFLAGDGAESHVAEPALGAVRSALSRLRPAPASLPALDQEPLED